MRYSSQRKAVFEAVRSTDCHPDAEWVYREVKKVIPRISLATVYRNLKELSSVGLIDTVETEDKIIRYDGNTSSHIHFICKKCGKIIDIFCESGMKELTASLGHRTEREKVLLYGTCADCGSEIQ